MIPELGHFALILALLLALAQGTLPIIGAHRGVAEWMALARPAAQAQFAFVLFAWCCLVASFVADDFSVINVAQNGNTLLPLQYKIAASWGSHEGSLLLWVLMLSGWGVAVAAFSRHLPQEMVARVLGVMGMVAVGFILFMLVTSDPFDRMFPPAAEGRDLNPLLQDPGMVFHPPLLYMGYVGFSVAYAFAVAALLGGRMDAAWARWSRPWTTVAWCFLTLGIMLGSWWAYYELGWGGWWFWDPVENASFMPWLVGTALIHSLAVTEKRGTFKAWTVLLAIFAFSLSLLGTFLVRSGVLTSVHAFATDPARGVFILAFLVVVIGASLALFAWRAPRVGLGGSFDAVSRESMLLGNNVLLAVACGTVLLGTLYPLFLDALGLGKISVGPPYFDRVFVPVMAPLVFLMGVGPIARWKKAALPDLWARLKWALMISLVLGLLLPFVGNIEDGIPWSPMAAFGYWMAAWVVLASIEQIRNQIRHAPGSLPARLAAQPRGWWGMTLAHLGVAVFIIGVTSVRGYEVERDVKMAPGDTVSVHGYTFRFEGVGERRGPNFNAARGTVALLKNGKQIDTLHPEKRVYFAQSQMPMTEASIRTGITGDVYVSLGEPVEPAGSWTVRVYYKPFVTWIWGGCVLMALGGFLAASDRRYRALAIRQQAVATGRRQPAAA
ncbi:MAG: heme lyase CcmF/NrfE family subunit [Burkholderiales bacterium]|jgi:cytochrome c-type biogenesis protein CcmF|nr:heme lyase CcmF/NrfE family subunit [Burkholderiales bacterium]